VSQKSAFEKFGDIVAKLRAFEYNHPMQTLGQLLLYLLAGYLVGRLLTHAQRLRWADRLNRFVLYVSLPALVFVSMSGWHFDRRFALPVLSAWGLYALSAVAIVLLVRYYRWDRPLTGALLMSVPYGNTSFLGIPFTQAFFGAAGVPYAIVYDQLGLFLILSTLSEDPKRGRQHRIATATPPAVRALRLVSSGR
jgi:predicted permease